LEYFGGGLVDKELSERLAGRRVIASVSGGKDSAAMCLWLREQGIEHDRVFMDTGWEHDLTYEYLRGPLTALLGPIVEIRAPLLMEDLIRKKGMFPSRVRRFCTQELKVKPMQRYLAGRQDAGEELINAVGIRAAESDSRSKMPEWEWQDGFDCEVWRPIISWSEQQVIDIHRRHGLAPNPLYLLGATRVGCWPCIHARKSEIRLIADKDPARIVRLRLLEDQVAVAAEARAERDGREFTRPAWFQNPVSRSVDGKRDGLCWPIEKVVEWSRTVRGGSEEDRQENLFASMNDGCMRWGLCDTGTGK
jgi:3'-phosphoadenosine 5'-phosphosulfate sulfotransferase (PAPS reductase)/FAD synthetase